MQFAIYEPKITLALKKEAGGVTVQAVDATGSLVYCGNLLHFKSDGTVDFVGAVSKAIGFQLEPGGRIKQAPEC